MSQDYTPAVWVPASGHWFPGHDARRKWIIVHGTAGGSSAQGIAQYFQTVPSSTHYVIGPDGTVVQCVSENDSAWGNAPAAAGCDAWWGQFANPNFVTLSIEHVKASSDNSDALTDTQKAASFALIAHLCDTWGIPRQMADASGGITGHFSIDPINRARCPGPYPWADLMNFLGGHVMAGLPASWQQQGDGIVTPNGKVIRGGILSLFQQGTVNILWDGNYPVDAIHQDADGVWRQTYKLFRIFWREDGSGGYDDIGDEHIALKQQLDAANHQITTLQAQIAGWQAPPPAPSDPDTQKALTLYHALKSSLS